MDVAGAWAMDQERRGGPVRICSMKGFSWHSQGNGRGSPGMGSVQRDGRGGSARWTRPGIQRSGWGVPVGDRRETKISSGSIGCGRRVLGESAMRKWVSGKGGGGEKREGTCVNFELRRR
jgi:hypothetical protein